MINGLTLVLAGLSGMATYVVVLLALGRRYRRFADRRSCRVCGCTDERVCLGGCAWLAPDLCSAHRREGR